MSNLSTNQRWTIGLTIAALGVALITGTFIGWQTILTRDALTSADLDRRPWVGISGLGAHAKTPIPTVGVDFYTFVNWKNFGRTPAFHVKRAFVSDVKRPAIPLPPCADCGDGDVMLPDVPIVATPHIEGATLTQGVAEEIKSGRQKIWFVGRIDYVDGGGSHHKTGICYNFLWDGSFRACDIPGSNYAD